MVVLLGALLAADVATRAWAESKLAAYARSYYPPAGGADASIRSFPFMGRLLATGSVPEVSLVMTDVQPGRALGGVAVVSRLIIELDRVEVDRGELFRGRVRVLDIGQGRIEAMIDGGSLAKALGADLRFRPGEVEVHQNVGGTDVFARGRVELRGNVVTVVPISVEGVNLPLSSFALRYEIPGVELLPCPAQVALVEGGISVACTIDDVPAALVQAVN